MIADVLIHIVDGHTPALLLERMDQVESEQPVTVGIEFVGLLLCLARGNDGPSRTFTNTFEHPRRYRGRQSDGLADRPAAVTRIVEIPQLSGREDACEQRSKFLSSESLSNTNRQTSSRRYRR